MSTLSPEKVADLKRQYGDRLRKVTIDDDVFVMRGPSRPEWSRFEKSESDQRREDLLRYCVVFPDNAGLEAVLERRPALVVVLTQKAIGLAGTEEKVHDEKL